MKLLEQLPPGVRAAHPTELISARCYASRGSLHFYLTMRVGCHRLRVYIRRSPADDASWAEVERWDGNDWQQVCNRPITECECAQLHPEGGADPKDFSADAQSLMEEALKIVI